MTHAHTAVLGGICIAIIVVMAPRTVHITTQLHAGEWAHVRPERNTHGSVTYTFTTVPAANAATASRTLAEATAHVYDISRFGEVYEYVCCPFLHPFLCCDFPHSSWFHTQTGDVVAAGLAGPRTGEPQLEHVAVHDAEFHARHLHPSDTHSSQPRRHKQPRVCVSSLSSLFFPRFSPRKNQHTGRSRSGSWTALQSTRSTLSFRLTTPMRFRLPSRLFVQC